MHSVWRATCPTGEGRGCQIVRREAFSLVANFALDVFIHHLDTLHEFVLVGRVQSRKSPSVDKFETRGLGGRGPGRALQ